MSYFSSFSIYGCARYTAYLAGSAFVFLQVQKSKFDYRSKTFFRIGILVGVTTAILIDNFISYNRFLPILIK
jgi:hypothetical protein